MVSPIQEAKVEEFLRSNRSPSDTLDLVFAGRRHLHNGLYEVGFPKGDFLQVYMDVVSCLPSARVQHTRFKSYRTVDLTCDNHENRDIKVYQTIVNNCAELGDGPPPHVLGIACTRDTLPVSAFPCSTNVADVRYVKLSTVCLGVRGAELCFESSTGNGADDEGDCIHKIFVRVRIGGGMEAPVSSVLRAVRMVADRLRLRQLDADAVAIPSGCGSHLENRAL